MQVKKGKVVWNLGGQKYRVYRTTVDSGLYLNTFGTAGSSLDLLITNGNLSINVGYPNVHYATISGATLVRLTSDVFGEFGVLMHRFSAKVRDPLVRRLVWRYLRAGVEENGQWSPSEKGVPQGGPLSPLLANVVLHDLAWSWNGGATSS